MLEGKLLKALVIKRKNGANEVFAGYENCNVLEQNRFQENSRKNFLNNSKVSSIVLRLSKDVNSVFHSGFELDDVNIPVYVGFREDNMVEVGLDRVIYQQVCSEKGHNPVGGIPILAELPISNSDEDFFEKISSLKKDEILTDRVSKIYQI